MDACKTTIKVVLQATNLLQRQIMQSTNFGMTGADITAQILNRLERKLLAGERPTLVLPGNGKAERALSTASHPASDPK